MKGFTKKVYKRGEVTQPQADVLKCFSEFLTINETSKYLKISRVSVYKTIKRLISKGLLEKKSRGVYGVTEAGKKGLHSFIGLTYKLRQHNLSIKVKVLESPKNWDKKRNQLITMPYFNKRVDLKNNSYDLLNYGKMQLKTTSQSIIFKLPTIYASHVDNAIIQAMDMFYNALPRVENLFKVKLTKDFKANITIISQEYARLNDSLARLYKKEDNKLYITDEEGKVWLIADYSFNVNELETISPEKAAEDMDIVHKFLNDLRNNPTTFTDVKKEQFAAEEVIKQMSKNITKLSVQVYEITNYLNREK